MRRAAIVGLMITVVSACGGLTAPLDFPVEDSGATGTTGSSSGSPVGVTGSSGSSSSGGHHEAGSRDASIDHQAGPPDAGVLDVGPPDMGPPDVEVGHYCPPTEAQLTGTCQLPTGVLCEYGTNANPACDAMWECLDGWLSTVLPPLSCYVGSCPATLGDIPQGASCPGKGLSCGYPEGQCNCSDLDADAGHTDLHWTCSSPPGCPEPRPRLGTPCSQPGLVCDYGSCSGSLSESCTTLGWVETAAPCNP